MAEVLISNKALKDLRGLESSVRKTILEKLLLASPTPLRNARKLVNPKIGTFRYRIGDYRVVFDLENDRVVVLRVGHRRDVYL